MASDKPRRVWSAPLAFPELVRIIARPAPAPQLLRAGESLPAWWVRPMDGSTGCVGPGQMHPDDVLIDARLEVLVVPPPGCHDLRAGYWLGREWVNLPSAWAPAVRVSRSRHDPSKGWFDVDQFPLILFGELPYAA